MKKIKNTKTTLFIFIIFALSLTVGVLFLLNLELTRELSILVSETETSIKKCESDCKTNLEVERNEIDRLKLENADLTRKVDELQATLNAFNSSLGINTPPQNHENLLKLKQMNNLQIQDRLCSNNNWSHTLSNGDTFGDRMDQVELKDAGEILYKGDKNINTAMQMWMESPSHKDVIEKGYQFMNMSCVPDNEQEWFCVGNFANF